MSVIFYDAFPMHLCFELMYVFSLLLGLSVSLHINIVEFLSAIIP